MMERRTDERPVRLLMTGSPYFNQQTRDIALRSEHWQVTNLPPAATMRFRALFVPIFVKSLLQNELWYQCGGVASWEHELRCQIALGLGVPTIIHWIGSDVLGVRARLQKRPGLVGMLRRVVNWATAPWLVDELAHLGIDASFIPFTSMKRREYLDTAYPAFPARFTVLTSIPERRKTFYGWEHLMRLAEDFPEVSVNVLRTSATSTCAKPPNVNLLGWMDDTLETYRNCTVAVRMTEHDGYSGSIQEPLALGRYAIWTHSFPGALAATDYPALRAHVTRLLRLHEDGRLEPNEEGRRFIKHELNPDTLGRNLEDALYRCARAPHR